MKKTDFSEIKNLDEKALAARAKKLKAEMADHIVDKHMNKLSNLKVIAKSRKELANILTVLRQKQLIREFELVTEGEK